MRLISRRTYSLNLLASLFFPGLRHENLIENLLRPWRFHFLSLNLILNLLLLGVTCLLRFLKPLLLFLFVSDCLEEFEDRCELLLVYCFVHIREFRPVTLEISVLILSCARATLVLRGASDISR